MPFRPDRLTEKTQEAIQQAQSLAQEAQHQEITPEHLLLALLQQQDGTVPPILQQVGVDPARVAAELKAQLDKLPKVYGAETYLGSRLRRLLDAASTTSPSGALPDPGPSVPVADWAPAPAPWA